MVCRMVVIVEEAVMFYGVSASVYEIDDAGKSTPICTRMVTHGKTEADGFEGALEALKAFLY